MNFFCSKCPRLFLIRQKRMQFTFKSFALCQLNIPYILNYAKNRDGKC